MKQNLSAILKRPMPNPLLVLVCGLLLLVGGAARLTTGLVEDYLDSTARDLTLPPLPLIVHTHSVQTDAAGEATAVQPPPGA